MTAPQAPRDDARFSMLHFVRALSLPLIATMVVLLVWRLSQGDAAVHVKTAGSVALVEKDSEFHVIPASRGGPHGTVAVARRDRALALTLHAQGLAPGRRYAIELKVDDVAYTIASRAADAQGALALDTTLTQFADGVCVGANWRPPRGVTARVHLGFGIKNDGSPPSGTMPATTSEARGGADLPCAGNGDGNFRYVLYEARPMVLAASARY